MLLTVLPFPLLSVFHAVGFVFSSDAGPSSSSVLPFNSRDGAKGRRGRTEMRLVNSSSSTATSSSSSIFWSVKERREDQHGSQSSSSLLGQKLSTSAIEPRAASGASGVSGFATSTTVRTSALSSSSRSTSSTVTSAGGKRLLAKDGTHCSKRWVLLVSCCEFFYL